MKQSVVGGADQEMPEIMEPTTIAMMWAITLDMNRLQIIVRDMRGDRKENGPKST